MVTVAVWWLFVSYYNAGLVIVPKPFQTEAACERMRMQTLAASNAGATKHISAWCAQGEH